MGFGDSVKSIITYPMRFVVGPYVESYKMMQKKIMIRNRLMDMKIEKKKRDIQMSMNVAIMRDRLYFLGAAYCTLGLTAFVRVAILKFKEPIPLKIVPMIIIPFWIAYLTDLAYFNKMDRIKNAGMKILNEETHWWNEPMELPPQMRSHYLEMMEDTNKELRELGFPEEKHWAQ
eukprot:TRINITY_DN2303_c0_g1_i2.p1 TRINITY_DN2303_c0_g1~~TRINITY_DN2303_c0_g1_i2.p1  ORF type:complete len:174 (-),score=25.04 TRINITY_DN2303_c0_g1_i2:36-557(-)